MALSKYRHVLQENLQLNDSRWEYRVPDLPRPSDSDRAGYMKSCSLNANSTKQNVVLSYIKISPNRAISEQPLSAFVHITCPGFRLHTQDGKPATFRESSEYISRFLKQGLMINGTKYSFYGHSNSQLKGRSCFLMMGSQNEVDRRVEMLGDFSKIKTVAKKAKRIGLLFSTAHTIINVDPARCKDIADIERDDYIFTDGCGNISPRLAKLLTQKKPILYRNKRYHPSVFQIRYRGYKGVVILDPHLDASTWLELRKSMRKFAGGNDHSFAVVEHSKGSLSIVERPYTYGYLNDEIVLLLHVLGIKYEIIVQKQEEHLDFLETAAKDPRYAFRFLTSVGSHELAERVLVEGIETVQKQLQRMIAQEHDKMLNKRNEYKCRILIPKSRLLFGVCDHRGILQEGECHIRPTADEDGIPHSLTGTYVLVARNPCLHPGDLQKLRVTARPELAHLVDCIVFPTRGRRPAADMMSGGDLDGDTFFVCWDNDLVPSTIAQPAEYPGGKEPVSFSAITSYDRIDYFAKSSSMQLGQVKNLFMKWARSKGPLSSQCQELNRLFSQCVDANKIEIPERLMSVPDEQTAPEFILDLLHDAARRRVQTYSVPRVIESASSEDTLLAVLANSAGWSQFELAQMTLRWCQAHNARFEDFWQFFDHTQLSSEERMWFLAQLPARSDIPGIIMNDLMHSEILAPAELSSLGLGHSRIRWRCVYNSTTDRIANLLDAICRTFPFVTRKLLVLRFHDRLSVAIYLPKIVDPADGVSIERCGRLFAFPHTRDGMTNSRVVVPTKHNAHLYYDYSAFRLYEGHTANTFVHLVPAPNDNSGYRNTKGKGNQARAREETLREGANKEWWTSIALQKFSQTLATHIGSLRREDVSAAELYIISNTDTRSFRNIDLWLEQIDTDKVHRNFERDLEEADERPNFADVTWQDETNAVVNIAKDRKYCDLGKTSTTDLARCLELAWQRNLRDLTNDLYLHVMEQLRSGGCVTSSQNAVLALVEFLKFIPDLVIWFVRLRPWSQLHSSVREQLLEYVPQLVVALVECANKVGRLAASSIHEVLSECTQLRVENLKSIVETVALTIASPESALDVLMEGLEPMTSRLLLLTPRDSQYLMKQLAAIAIDHIEEAADNAKSSRSIMYEWKFAYPLVHENGNLYLKCDYRIDAPKTIRLAVGDHVKLVCVKAPSHIIMTEPAYFEALVEKSDAGQATFKCLRHPPIFYQQSLWRLEHLGSFVTAQTMIDAVAKLIAERQACCDIFSNLFPSQQQIFTENPRVQPRADLSELNASQRSAVVEALNGPVTCIWGPPGTGKTHTIVSIIREILSDKEQRLLVTAPTHNAVDNVMRKYMDSAKGLKNTIHVNALRVSTDVRKVSADLLSYTCDAMLGKDINQFLSARRKAQKQISQSRLVFTTCIGAGLGLLRNEHFENVIIDEASQQTEPLSLVPLVKGCSRAILVGDHVQLRATVQPNAATLGHDVSLFERLWVKSISDQRVPAVRRVMLDTQYRMHPAICAFPSNEFYEGKLMTANHCKHISIPASSFRWPENGSRSVFIQVTTLEDLGRKSKFNAGQADICQKVLEQLRTAPVRADKASSQPQLAPSYSIAILTPYTRQAEQLKRLLPNEKISSIDGFQGQEADVIVYVSVRCNVHGEIGFLKDMRRLNVALTRARAGTIIIGDESTLSGKMRIGREGEDEREECYDIWKRLIRGCGKVDIEG